MKDFLCLSCRFGAIFLLGLAAGCGDSGKGTVSGTVTYKDKPLSGGTILFVSANGVERGEIKTDGTYRVEGVPVGAVKVAVEPLQQISPQVRQRMEQGWGKKAPPTRANPSADSASTSVNLPSRYKDVETSGLSCTVQGGNQTCDFPLD